MSLNLADFYLALVREFDLILSSFMLLQYPFPFFYVNEYINTKDAELRDIIDRDKPRMDLQANINLFIV
jgi:hypothetical protein